MMLEDHSSQHLCPALPLPRLQAGKDEGSFEVLLCVTESKNPSIGDSAGEDTRRCCPWVGHEHNSDQLGLELLVWPWSYLESPGGRGLTFC